MFIKVGDYDGVMKICQEPYTEVYGVNAILVLEHAQDLFLLSHELKYGVYAKNKS